MSSAMDYIEKQIKLFSLKEKLQLLAYIANNVNLSEKELSVANAPRRSSGGLTGKFWMADDFDETPDCFKEYM